MTSDVFLDQTLPDWQQQFDHLTQRIGDLLPRLEIRQQARDYLQALLSPIERKNGWREHARVRKWLRDSVTRRSIKSSTCWEEAAERPISFCPAR